MITKKYSPGLLTGILLNLPLGLLFLMHIYTNSHIPINMILKSTVLVLVLILVLLIILFFIGNLLFRKKNTK
ncbi:hypothetical protein D3C71_2214260 [compost metagenome]